MGTKRTESPSKPSTHRVVVTTGLEGGAYVWRKVLFVGRARTATATAARVERAIAAASRSKR